MAEGRIEIGGRVVTLDARPDRLDLRDLPFHPAVRPLPPRHPADAAVAAELGACVAARLILDQGSDGACTGFGLAAVVNYLLWRRRRAEGGRPPARADRVSPGMLYHLARFYDEWPGEDYDGSSCRGALKGWHKHGVCSERKWPYAPRRFVAPADVWDVDAVRRPLGVYYRIDRASVVDMQAAIAETGAVYVCAHVHAGWQLAPRRGTPVAHDDLPQIAFRPEPAGGHAFALVGYNEWGFVVQNSWGRRWGAQGFAVLTYEDWVTHGSDAWVVALGAPVARAVVGTGRGATALRAPRHFVAGRVALPQTGGLPGWLGGSDPLAWKHNAWSEAQAYEHTLVVGNDGIVVNQFPDAADAAAAARRVAFETPLAWLRKQPRGRRRIAIYAHGGLNARQESIRRIRVLAPYFARNGIHPVFVTWQTGWLETLGNLLDDEARRLFGGPMPQRGLPDAFVEATDRMLEGACRRLIVRPLWAEMKENAGLATEEGRGIAVLGAHLGALSSALGGDLSIHVVAHSAGAYVAGRLLGGLALHGLAAADCTLYAPACDLAFAQSHFAAAVDGGTLARERLFVHVLSDARERDDAVGPYRKSLLYLVSRALERQHKTPLMGLAGAFDPARADRRWWHDTWLDDVDLWQRWFWADGAPDGGFAESGVPPPGGGLAVLDERSVSAGPRAIPATHGSFDNDVAAVALTLRRMLGLAPEAALPAPVDDLDY
jgi:hypothetical protein